MMPKHDRYAGENMMATGMRGAAVCCILMVILVGVLCILAITGRYNFFTALAHEEARIERMVLQEHLERR